MYLVVHVCLMNIDLQVYFVNQQIFYRFYLVHRRKLFVYFRILLSNKDFELSCWFYCCLYDQQSDNHLGYQ